MKQNMVLNQETNGKCVSRGKSPVAIGIDIHWKIKEKTNTETASLETTKNLLQKQMELQ